jgi:hypothetical protein
MRLVSALSSLSVGHSDGDASRAQQDEHEQHDPLAPECRYCPLCAVARAARSMTPDVREHLASAAASLLFAARDFLDELAARADGERDAQPPVEKIDLAED